MKKILVLLGSFVLIATPVTAVIACGDVSPRTLLEKISLNSVITINNLESFNQNPSNEEVLAKTKALNPSLNLSQVEITKNENGVATIQVRTNSVDYEAGFVEVYYTDPTNPIYNLNAIIDRIYLGQYPGQPTDEEILDRVKILNNNLDLSQVELTSNANNQAILTVIPNSKIYLQGEIILTYTVDERSELANILTTRNLGRLSFDPTVPNLIQEIQKQNNQLNISQLQITNISQTNMTLMVIPNSKIYRAGSATLNFIILYPLRTIIKTTNLGQFDTVPTNEEILARVKSLNSNLDNSQIEVSQHQNNQITIRVISNSIVYRQSSINLTYVLNLASFSSNTNLGQFTITPSDSQILTRLKDLNPNLNLNEIELVSSGNGQAVIQTKVQSTFYNQARINLTYQVNEVRGIEEIVLASELGTFTAQPTSEQILARAKELNPNLDLTQVEIVSHWVEGATIKVIPNSPFYRQGWVPVTYRVR